MAETPPCPKTFLLSMTTRFLYQNYIILGISLCFTCPTKHSSSPWNWIGIFPWLWIFANECLSADSSLSKVSAKRFEHFWWLIVAHHDERESLLKKTPTQSLLSLVRGGVWYMVHRTQGFQAFSPQKADIRFASELQQVGFIPSRISK